MNDYDRYCVYFCILSFVWVFAYHNSVPFVTGILKAALLSAFKAFKSWEVPNKCPNEPSSMNSEEYIPKGRKD